jgi:hypothetical protein
VLGEVRCTCVRNLMPKSPYLDQDWATSDAVDIVQHDCQRGNVTIGSGLQRSHNCLHFMGKSFKTTQRSDVPSCEE